MLYNSLETCFIGIPQSEVMLKGNILDMKQVKMLKLFWN